MFLSTEDCGIIVALKFSYCNRGLHKRSSPAAGNGHFGASGEGGKGGFDSNIFPLYSNIFFPDLPVPFVDGAVFLSYNKTRNAPFARNSLPDAPVSLTRKTNFMEEYT